MEEMGFRKLLAGVSRKKKKKESRALLVLFLMRTGEESRKSTQRSHTMLFAGHGVLEMSGKGPRLVRVRFSEMLSYPMMGKHPTIMVGCAWALVDLWFASLMGPLGCCWFSDLQVVLVGNMQIVSFGSWAIEGDVRNGDEHRDRDWRKMNEMMSDDRSFQDFVAQIVVHLCMSFLALYVDNANQEADHRSRKRTEILTPQHRAIGSRDDKNCRHNIEAYVLQ
ncbi:hypothetical protein KFK09_001699 [Dendrobium nobile]|uniref:Uncharacterized protein n=1 Tax=Dendrobium nobile TaxID=94219 RepID=A0A8T3CBM5_DENNO|nr:hypothetical protein KFK09_001699 [Dendrobium nobile]